MSAEAGTDVAASTRADFVLGLASKDGGGIPLSIAGRVMMQIAEAYPNTTMAETWGDGIAIAVSIKWDDVHALERLDKELPDLPDTEQHED